MLKCGTLTTGHLAAIITRGRDGHNSCVTHAELRFVRESGGQRPAQSRFSGTRTSDSGMPVHSTLAAIPCTRATHDKSVVAGRNISEFLTRLYSTCYDLLMSTLQLPEVVHSRPASCPDRPDTVLTLVVVADQKAQLLTKPPPLGTA